MVFAWFCTLLYGCCMVLYGVCTLWMCFVVWCVVLLGCVVVGVLWVCFAVGLSGCCWGLFCGLFSLYRRSSCSFGNLRCFGAMWSNLGDVSPLGLPMKFCLYFYLCAAKGVIGLPLFCGAVVGVGVGALWCWGGCGVPGDGSLDDLGVDSAHLCASFAAICSQGYVCNFR
jgi:hypothetical protein